MKPKRAEDIIAALREDRTRLSKELEESNQRLEQFHEILDRKNTIIRMLAMGDCTAAELRLSDAEKFALLP